jgi:RHS repeat-associated protein
MERKTQRTMRSIPDPSQFTRRHLLALAALLGLLLLVPSSASATALPSPITEDTTLTPAGNPYTGSTTIESGATLTVEAGVRLEPNLITVEGTLDVEGTEEEPVVFTGSKEEKAGEWCSIDFQSGSGASVIDHAEVKYGGACGGGEIRIYGSSPMIENSTISHAKTYGVEAYRGGSPHIAYNRFLANGAAAVYYHAFYTDEGTVDIHNNTVEGGPSGIVVTMESKAPVSGKDLGENTITETTTGSALSYSGSDIPGNVTGNTLSGNKKNYISVSGTVAHSETWTNGGAAVKVETGVTVGSGYTLTISPGLLLINPGMTIKGTLDAEGTDAEPIFFTGEDEEEAGEWAGIDFEAGSGSSVIDHAEVAFGGSGGNGMIEARGSHPTITNSTIRKSAYYGIKVTESGSPTIEWDRFRGNTNGVYYSGTGELAAPNNDWGCGSGPSPAGCGDSVNSKVDWEPAIDLPELAGHCRGKESQCGEGADPVSLATGQLDYSHRDLLLTNKSEMPLEFARAYNSGSEADTGLGPGWSQTALASATELESGEVLVVRQDGRQDLFAEAEGGGYEAPSGVTDTLAKVEGAFQLTTLRNTVYRFDASGRIASIADDHGLETTYAYNASGRLATITDPSGQTLTFTYNASNHITKVTDSTGREVKFAYSAAGDLETVTDALGGVTKYAYDSQHRITSITDPREHVILENVYDEEGRIVEQLDGLEGLWQLEYKEDETIVTEPEGGERVDGFDSQDRVVSETDQLGHTTTISYDAAGNVDEVVQPGGAKWELGHDSAGNLTSVTDPEGGERSYEYNARNELTGFTDARGNAWSYEWSEADDLTKVTDPEEGETTLTYDEAGEPLTRTDANGHETELGYDSRGNLVSETDPLGHETSYEYDSRNYLTAKTLPGLEAEAFGRDAYGDLTSRTTPEGNTTEYAYDANGLPTQVTDPAEDVWTIQRNAMERPTVYEDPLEGKVEIAYNGDLKPTKVTNRRGKETTYGYDAANRLTEVKRPEGEDWEFGYDKRGNRTSVVDPRENETTYEYDLLSRMTKATEPLEVATEYGYDANGDLTSIKDPRANTTSYAYDNLGRLTEAAQPLEKTTTYGYDGVGDPLSKTTAAGTLEYAYDAANRLSEVKAGESTLRSYAYNSDNRLTSAVDAQEHEIEIGRNEDGLVSSITDGRGQSLARSYDSRGYLTKQEDGRGTLEYGYDKLGRLTSLTDPQGKELGFGYDAEGDLTEVERPNGVTTANVYDNAGRLSETTSVEGEPPTALESLKYGYDAAGDVTSRLDQRLESETTYAYDALNRLTEFNPPGEGATAYGYDKAGNRTEAGSATYSYNALNQLTESSAGTTYSYDGAGRMTAKASEAEETAYEWDLLDHLARVEGPTETTSYAYDGLERLSERKGTAGTQILHYGDLTDLPTYLANGEGETMTSYVQGAHGLAEQRSGEATAYPLADAHGDITAISGPTGGVESRQEYGPWGEQLSGPSLEMGYLGAWERPTDPATGLIQMGARSYDPALGSFMTEDPVMGHLGVGASVDRYPYVWDNPLSRYDLNGRDLCGTAGEVPVVGGVLEAGCHTATYHSPVEPTPLEDAEELGKRAPDFVKATKNFLNELNENFTETERLRAAATYAVGEAACKTAQATAADGPPGEAVAATADAICLSATYGSAIELGSDLGSR